MDNVECYSVAVHAFVWPTISGVGGIVVRSCCVLLILGMDL